MTFLENKTVLITGASGFIGTHLVERLANIHGIRLLLLSRQSRESRLPHVKWLQGSLAELAPRYWEEKNVRQVDVVFHLGAFTPKSTSNANTRDCIYSDNLIGTRVLLEGLPIGVERIVFSSTLDVYSPTGPYDVLTETSPAVPNSLYGASKLFCERLVSLWAAEKGCRYSILRYGHIFGPGEESYKKLIPVVIQQLLSDRSPSIPGQGKAERDFLHVSDAVEATIRAACANGDIEPVNIVRGTSLPIREIVEYLIKASAAQVRINYLSEKPDGHSLKFDNSLMKRLLGSWEFKPLFDGLSAEIAYFRRLGHGN